MFGTWKEHCKQRNILFWILATNPIDVIKIRMQLENELIRQKGLDVLRNRYYDGFVKGAHQIYKDEGIRGLYKG